MALLGDFIAGITEAVTGKKPCGPCEKRRQAMNAADQKVRDAVSGKARRGKRK